MTNRAGRSAAGDSGSFLSPPRVGRLSSWGCSPESSAAEAESATSEAGTPGSLERCERGTARDPGRSDEPRRPCREGLPPSTGAGATARRRRHSSGKRGPRLASPEPGCEGPSAVGQQRPLGSAPREWEASRYPPRENSPAPASEAEPEWPTDKPASEGAVPRSPLAQGRSRTRWSLGRRTARTWRRPRRPTLSYDDFDDDWEAARLASPQKPLHASAVEASGSDVFEPFAPGVVSTHSDRVELSGVVCLLHHPSKYIRMALGPGGLAEGLLPRNASRAIWSFSSLETLLSLRTATSRNCLVSAALSQVVAIRQRFLLALCGPQGPPEVSDGEADDQVCPPSDSVVDAGCGAGCPPATPAEELRHSSSLGFGAQWFGLSTDAVWRSLCSARVDDVESYGPHLVQIVARLPHRFVSHVVALACGDMEEDGKAEPTGTSPRQRPERRRDVLPLVFGNVSAEDLPKRASKFTRHEWKCRSSWLLVLLAALNFSFNGGRAYLGARPLYGPPTQSQYSS